MTLRITSPHFVAGIVLAEDDGVAHRSAPIIAYMRHWTLERIKRYCKNRRWTVEVLP